MSTKKLVWIYVDSNKHKDKLFISSMESEGKVVLSSKVKIVDYLESSQLNELSIILCGEQSWTLFKEAYEECKHSPIIYINGGLADVDSLVISYETESIQLQNKMTSVRSAISRFHKPTYLFDAALPMVLPEGCHSIYLISKSSKLQKEKVLKDLLSRKVNEVCFLAEHEKVVEESFPIVAWKILLTISLPEINLIDRKSTIIPLRMKADTKPTTLFVFPERMLPLTRAYYVRGFDLILGLFSKGVPLHVVVLGPNNKDLEKIERILSVFCSNVTTRPLIRGEFPLYQKAVRKAESKIRKALGENRNAPIRFNERAMVFATKRNTTTISDIIEAEPSIRSVVFTGAWFYPALKPIQKKHPDIKFYCDTHDVFYDVDYFSNRDQIRVFYSARRQKSREIQYLNSIDGVVAISISDESSYLTNGVKSRIYQDSGSFEHANFGVDPMAGPKEMVFGFIGTSNDNNRNCLRIIEDSWWPAIVSKLPNARLAIAGSACKTEEAILLNSSHSSVSLLGFVDDLSQFYNEVQVMLSPIFVRGGLNFKSAESLLAGRPLLTNKMGAECVANVEHGVLVLDESLSNLNELIEVIQNSRSRGYRAQVHESAKIHFGQSSAYEALADELLAS